MKTQEAVTNDQLDDLVAEWHASTDDRPLERYMADHLGWTVADVSKWILDGRYRPA